MSLRLFLDHISQSPEDLRSFFDKSRHVMLRLLGRKFWYVPHQLLEDAVMLVFGQLWGGELDKFASVHPFRSESYRDDLIRFMCFALAKRRLLDLLKRHKKEILIGDMKLPNENDASDDELFDRLLPPSDSDPVSGDQERRELLQRLQRCVSNLSPKLRDVVSGLLDDERQYDTANALGIPEGTVKSRMNEAIKKLKRCMGISVEEAV